MRLHVSAPVREHRLSCLEHCGLGLCVLAIAGSGLMIAAAQSWCRAFLVDAAGRALFVIGGHVAAALWHKLVRRGGMWEAMDTPWWVPRLAWLRRSRS
jgi:hypothetical protein